MAYAKLEDVTGLGKSIVIRDKYTRVSFIAGSIQDEVSLSDGEQKHFIQRVQLADNVTCEGDATRHIFRIGYYTRRSDGWFCLGSQFAPMLTPAEIRELVRLADEKGWLTTR
jgi:hypothetical protein